MIDRDLLPSVTALLKKYPAVALLGPRQVGKTSLARKIARSLDPRPVYLDLELNSDLAKLTDPQLYLESVADRLVIVDEAQRRPDLFPLLRALIDQKRRNGRFLLLGSANLNLVKGVSESLAGRIAYCELSPFLRTEVLKRRVPITRHWFLGGYPLALLSKNEADGERWLESLMTSYLERDLPLLGFRIPAMELRRFITMLSHNQGELWNGEKMASNFGVSNPTVSHYRSILEQMFLVRSLPPWHSNLKKRLVKSPRVYVRDSGLLHNLLGISSYQDLLAHPVSGKSWEGFVIEQILGRALSLTSQRIESSFFRSHAGAEIDLILHRAKKILATVEIKLGVSPQLKKGLHEARKDLGMSPTWVITSQSDRYPLGKGIVALGLDRFLQEVLPAIIF